MKHIIAKSIDSIRSEKFSKNNRYMWLKYMRVVMNKDNMTICVSTNLYENLIILNTLNIHTSFFNFVPFILLLYIYIYNEHTNAHLIGSLLNRSLFIAPTYFNANASYSGGSYSVSAKLNERVHAVFILLFCICRAVIVTSVHRLYKPPPEKIS
jgi:hypothetical protein